MTRCLFSMFPTNFSQLKLSLRVNIQMYRTGMHKACRGRTVFG